MTKNENNIQEFVGQTTRSQVAKTPYKVISQLMIGIYNPVKRQVGHRISLLLREQVRGESV